MRYSILLCDLLFRPSRGQDHTAFVRTLASPYVRIFRSVNHSFISAVRDSPKHPKVSILLRAPSSPPAARRTSRTAPRPLAPPPTPLGDLIRCGTTGSTWPGHRSVSARSELTSGCKRRLIALATRVGIEHVEAPQPRPLPEASAKRTEVLAILVAELQGVLSRLLFGLRLD